MKDLIERQVAIDAVKKNTFRLTFAEEQNCEGHVAWSANAIYSDVIEGALLELPSAQSEPHYDEWCTDCKEYDHERHCCPRWNRVIRETLKDAQPNTDHIYAELSKVYNVKGLPDEAIGIIGDLMLSLDEPSAHPKSEERTAGSAQNVQKEDLISRKAAIDAVKGLPTWWADAGGYYGGAQPPMTALLDPEDTVAAIDNLPSAQPEPSEITDEQAIMHLQSTGWMQNHDREMYESGLRERLADDSDSYDALLPSAQPEIIACGDCKHWICHDRRCGYWNHGVKPLEWCCHAERRSDEGD